MVDVFIKNFDEKAYRLAKAMAAKEDKRIGELLSEYVYVGVNRNKTKKGFAGLKPVSFGRGNENLSMEIDEILYGD